MIPVIKPRQYEKRLLNLFRRLKGRKNYIRNTHITKLDQGDNIGSDDSIIKVTGETRLTAESISVITIATITGDQDLHFVRAQYSIPGLTDPVPLGYDHPSKTGGGVHILKIYKDSGSLKADVYNDGPVDVDIRIFYSNEAST